MIARAVAFLLLVGTTVPSAAAGPTPEQAAERKAIHDERAAVEARYRAAERECRERFVVASCIEQQQAIRRAALAELRRRELVIDEAVRHADAEEAARRVQAKEAEVAKREPSGRARPGAASQPQAEPPVPSTPVLSASAPAPAAPRRSTTADDPAKAAERAQAQARRASEAAAHRESVERRNAQHAAKKKGKAPEAPLPVPDAASAPAR